MPTTVRYAHEFVLGGSVATVIAMHIVLHARVPSGFELAVPAVVGMLALLGLRQRARRRAQLPAAVARELAAAEALTTRFAVAAGSGLGILTVLMFWVGALGWSPVALAGLSPPSRLLFAGLCVGMLGLFLYAMRLHRRYPERML